MGAFPALMIKPPESPLQQLAGVEQLKGAIQQQQMGEIQLQEARLNQQSQQVLMESFARNNGDFNKTYADAAASGKVTPQMLTAFRTQGIAAQTQAATLTEKQLANHAKLMDMATNEFESLKGITDEGQFQKALKASVGRLLNENAQPNDVLPFAQMLAQDHSPEGFKTLETALMGPTWVMNNAKQHLEAASAATPQEVEAQRQATLRETQAKADLAAAEAAEKGSPLIRMEHDPSQMAGDKLPAAIGYLKSKISDPTTEPQDVVRATRLLANANATQKAELAMAASKKQIDIAATQGDPRAAAQLLVSGAATLSQLKARGSTPEFIQQTLTAAKQIDPNWNAQEAEAAFDVAKSSANVAFFGSAKSLVDKGGTLDQLQAAARDIPSGKIPIFNKVSDAIEASTGSGPLAKYAAIALGVADDYAKVIGGGNPSDTGRLQGLKLIGAELSPEGRQGSVEGIRGSVNSQKNSRIGNNPILKMMYGGTSNLMETPEKSTGAAAAPSKTATTKTPPPGATHIVPGPDGKKHYTNAAGTVDLGVAE